MPDQVTSPYSRDSLPLYKVKTVEYGRSKRWIIAQHALLRHRLTPRQIVPGTRISRLDRCHLLCWMNLWFPRTFGDSLVHGSVGAGTHSGGVRHRPACRCRVYGICKSLSSLPDQTAFSFAFMCFGVIQEPSGLCLNAQQVERYLLGRKRLLQVAKVIESARVAYRSWRKMTT